MRCCCLPALADAQNVPDPEPGALARRSSAAREEGIVVPGFGGGGRRDNAAQLVRGDGERADGAGWVLRSVLRAPRS